jgi:DNA-binding XRE family transcriptional regulator
MENIKKLRGRAGLTQKQLADEIGVTRPAIHEMEKESRHNIKPKVAQKICNLFGVTMCELYGADNLKYPPSNAKEAEDLSALIERKYRSDPKGKDVDH